MCFTNKMLKILRSCSLKISLVLNFLGPDVSTVFDWALNNYFVGMGDGN